MVIGETVPIRVPVRALDTYIIDARTISRNDDTQ